MQLAQAGELAQQQAHVGLLLLQLPRQVAYPGRVEGARQQQGPEAFTQLLVRLDQLYPVIRQVQPGTAAGNLPGRQQAFQQGDEDRPFQRRESVAAQAITVGAEFVGGFGVKALQGIEQLLLQRGPALGGEQPSAKPRVDLGQCGGQLPALARAIELARQERRIEAIAGVRQQCWQGTFKAVALQCAQLLQALRAAPIARRGERVEHAAAAKGALRGLVTQHQVVAVYGMAGCIQHQLREGTFARLQSLAFQ